MEKEDRKYSSTRNKNIQGLFWVIPPSFEITPPNTIAVPLKTDATRVNMVSAGAVKVLVPGGKHFGAILSFL